MLAIGIVVDDAIVIVEGAAHAHRDAALPPKEATIKAMGELIGPVIGITLVLMAVFLPAAFLPGITGQLYRQFALDDRGDGRHQRRQRADAQAGAVRPVWLQTPDRPAQRVLPRLQLRLRTARRLATPASSAWSSGTAAS